MGDVCTDTPTRTIFATSTSQGGGSVSQSTSQSVSVGPGSVVTRSVQSGTEWIVTESSVGGSTETVQVEVPVTISGEQQVFTVPISTLFAPCTSTTPTSSTTSTTPSSTSTSTSTTPTSTTPETTETPESQTSSSTPVSRTSTPASSTARNTNANDNNTPTPTPSPSPSPSPSSTSPAQNGGNSVSQTGTLTTFSTALPTTLPNGAESTVVIVSVSSIAPSGGLNGNDNNGNNSGSSGSNSGRAVAIGVGVTGGLIALIILIFGITWHIRRKRRNAMPLDDSEIWGPHHEAKTPPQGIPPAVNNYGPGYTYNPYTDTRTTAYAPVPTMSPPRARPMVLAETDENRLSATSYGSQPTTGLTAPLLTRAKTADEILYEAAREDLPRSRASSATASHHTRPSETLSHRGHPSFAASHKTHGSLASRTSGSAVGLLDHPPASSAHSSVHVPAEPERPMSPVSIAAPRLAIVNPDVDKDL